jgi:serine/tyrosine/threonine adenylyltransferase
VIFMKLIYPPPSTQTHTHTYTHFNRSPNDVELGRTLFDYAVSEHFPQCVEESDRKETAKRVMKVIAASTAKMVVGWKTTGFTHGVLNTDNMSILGLTIDYGPYGWMEYFERDFIPNGSDGNGRYDWEHQEEICLWNLEKLAEAWEFGGVADSEEVKAVARDVYGSTFRRVFEDTMREKMGLGIAMEGDEDFFEELWEVMDETKADFTETFMNFEGFVASGGKGVGEALNNLVGSCADKNALEGIYSKKLQILKPSMPPNQILALWEMCQTEPEAVAAHFRAPVAAIVSEIKGDYEKLQKYAKYAQMKEGLGVLEEGGLEDKNRIKWREFLSKYKARLEGEGGGGDWEERVKNMKVANPRLTLRNWVLQHAIERAEKGDYGGVNELLGCAGEIWERGEGAGSVGGVRGETADLLKGKTRQAPTWAHGVFNT